MRRSRQGLVSRTLATVLVSLAVFASAGPFVATPALGATSTSFSPATVNLNTGQSTTITVAAVGLSAGDASAQFGITHNAANTRITNPQCGGIFAGARVFQQAVGFGDLLACTFGGGGASGTTGDVLTFTLTNAGGAAETITFDQASTFYLRTDSTQEPPGSLGTLVVTNTPTPCILGDINCDGIVDTRDYGVWRQSFGATDCGNRADIDANCIVDIRDYGIWGLNFGRTAPTPTPTATLTLIPTATPTATRTATQTTTPTATPTLLTSAAYVTNSSSDTVTVIDTTLNIVVGTPIPVGRSPFGIGVDSTVHRAYVANFGSNTVSVIDTRLNTIVGTPIPVGTAPWGVGVDSTTHRAYVTNLGGSTVSVIDTMSNAIVGTPIPAGVGPRDVGVDLTAHRAYIAFEPSNDVTVLDTTMNTVVGTPIPAGTAPNGVGVDPTVHRAYVANFNSANVTVIDTMMNIIVGTPIPTGGSPFGVGIGP
jgi:YVTN family beta-propeller protein